MKDKLDRMFETQYDFNSKIIDLSNCDKEMMTKEYVLHTIAQLTSLLDKINWKIHHNNNSNNVVKRDIKYEIVDSLKYVLSLSLLWDMDSKEMFEYFNHKSDVVNQRYLQDFTDLSDKNVVIYDIDGVLSTYPYSFINYVLDKEGINDKVFNCDTLDVYKFLHDKYNISIDTVRSYKEEYRTTGQSLYESTYTRMVSEVNKDHDLGFYVVLLTSRPLDKYKSLMVDTVQWLNENDIKYDMILSDSKKRDKVLDLVHKCKKVYKIIDDDPKMINNISNISDETKIYIVDRDYNKEYHNEKVERVY